MRWSVGGERGVSYTRGAWKRVCLCVHRWTLEYRLTSTLHETLLFLRYLRMPTAVPLNRAQQYFGDDSVHGTYEVGGRWQHETFAVPRFVHVRPARNYLSFQPCCILINVHT